MKMIKIQKIIQWTIKIIFIICQFIMGAKRVELLSSDYFMYLFIRKYIYYKNIYV
jgi:hypothetical protein